jgi:plasmid stabilization system protein ParE
MKLRWHREARFEAGAAARFYAERQPGLDQRFLDILEDALHRVRRHPEMYPRVEGDVHKCKLPRFPMGFSIERNRRRSKYSRSCTSSENQGTGRRDQAKSTLLGSLSECNQVAANLVVEPADFEYAPFAQEGGLGKVHQLFGIELNKIIEELNGVLAA